MRCADHLNPCRAERGNVLFLILIAVALFAALSYAVTSSNKGGGSGISKDKARIAAAEMMQYATQVEQAISRMMLINKTSETQIDPKAPQRKNVAGGSVTHDSTTCNNASCEIYNPEGGGMVYLEFERYATDTPSGWPSTYQATGHNNFIMMDVDGVGSDANDVVLRFIEIEREICDAVRDKMNTGAYVSPAGSYVDYVSAAQVNNLDQAAYSVTPTVPTRTFLSSSQGGIACYIYHVVLAR